MDKHAGDFESISDFSALYTFEVGRKEEKSLGSDGDEQVMINYVTTVVGQIHIDWADPKNDDIWFEAFGY